MNLEDLRRSLDEDGYGIVRGVLDAPALDALRASFDRLEQLARAIVAGEVSAPEATRFVVDANPFRLHRVVWAGGVDPYIASLGAHPAFLRPAAAALGADTLVQIVQQAHFKFPGDEVAFGWHQDASNRRYGSELWSDVDGRGSFVQLALAVDPMTPGNGPLRMVPGSHRQGFLADPLTGDLPELDTTQAVDVVLEPGDLAVFGPFVVHGSSANRGDTPRRLFLQGYTLPGANHRVYPGCGTGVERHVA